MLGLLMPVWGRAALSGAVLSYWAGKEFDHILRVAVVSPEDPDPPEIPAVFERVEAPNVMQTKWQAGLDAMRGTADAVMMMGSDDLATPALIDYIHGAALAVHMAHPQSIYWAEPATKRCSHVTYRTVFAGCAFSMEAVDSIGGELFVDGTKNAPDVVASTKVKLWMHRNGHRLHKTPRLDVMGEALVDIKTDVNKWSYDDMYTRATKKRTIVSEPDYDEFFSTHFPSFVYSG